MKIMSQTLKALSNFQTSEQGKDISTKLQQGKVIKLAQQ